MTVWLVLPIRSHPSFYEIRLVNLKDGARLFNHDEVGKTGGKVHPGPFCSLIGMVIRHLRTRYTEVTGLSIGQVQSPSQTHIKPVP